MFIQHWPWYCPRIKAYVMAFTLSKNGRHAYLPSPHLLPNYPTTTHCPWKNPVPYQLCSGCGYHMRMKGKQDNKKFWSLLIRPILIAWACSLIYFTFASQRKILLPGKFNASVTPARPLILFIHSQHSGTYSQPRAWGFRVAHHLSQSTGLRIQISRLLHSYVLSC